MPKQGFEDDDAAGNLTVEARTFGTTDRAAPAEAYGVALTTVEATGPDAAGPWSVCEVVTRNSIFRCDARFRCFEVVERATGQPLPDHKFLGRRLVGGQRHLGAMMWLCHPLPLAGSAAVFESPTHLSHYYTTSPVESVLLKVTSVTVAESESIIAWDHIARTEPDKPRR